MSWNDFEHQVWKTLKNIELHNNSRFVLAISGGLDSMALLEVMLQIKPQAEFKVAYFHHGEVVVNEAVASGTDEDADQASDEVLKLQKYRDDVGDLIQKHLSRFPNHQIQFITEKSEVLLKTEQQMRESRWSFLKKVANDSQPILTAHHLDDWVETLTLKLIRGVGPDGFVNFKMWDGVVFRPFLQTMKSDLQAYVQEKNISYLEDPSNKSDQYLRNWLRLEWFKSLDEKNPLGYQNYSRSLLRLQQALIEKDEFNLQFLTHDGVTGLDRNWYFSLSSHNQLRALALYLRHHSIFNFTQGQLEEIKKRLDKNQKDLTFNSTHVKWVINALQIMIEY